MDRIPSAVMSRGGGDYSGMLSDPLVPLDFGGWFRRVIGVFGRSFRRIASLAAVSAVLSAVTSIVSAAVTPTPEEARQMVIDAKITDPLAAMGMVYAKVLPYMLIFWLLTFVVTVLVFGASFFVAIRDANGQPGSALDGVVFAVPRLPRAVGWVVVAMLIVFVALAVPLLPALITRSDLVAVIGGGVAFLLYVYLGVVLFSSLLGVLFVDRAGIRRCFELIKGRFWATLGRLLTAVLVCIPYAIVLMLVLALLTWLAGSGSVIVAIASALLTIPLTVFSVAVLVVTYAELRFWENTAIATRTLTSELTR